MSNNESFRQRILDRLGSPAPELPGINYVSDSSPATRELIELFDDLCMDDIHSEAVFEGALRVLEGIRRRDFQAFYAGRSELLRIYPVVRELPEHDLIEPPSFAVTCLSLVGTR